MNATLEQLKGLVIAEVKDLDMDSDKVIFTFTSGLTLKMYHEQDCCENVYLADVCGDIADLVGGTVIYFDERTNTSSTMYGSQKATFYDIQTSKGCVNLRWIGESNGYYSEDVDLEIY